MRLDIQGLRAVAVLAVVVNHLTGHLQGGFLGVDVFFVISGYLITQLLLREGARTGTISFVGFYKRRIRRLFPAGLTVIVATVIAAHILFTAERAHTTLVDALWAVLFGANWRFISTGTNYFQSTGPTSPLQHYWSLSVEEQFYLVWPLVLLLVFIVCRKLFAGRDHATAATGTVAAAALTLGSLAYAWHQSTGNSVVSYFSTFTRGWELGLGAILAVTARYMRGNRAVLTALSWLGMAVIVASLFMVSQAHVPFPGAIPACLGSGLVIIAATESQRAVNPILTNRLARYIGDISYSIYVVHFPVIIFAGTLITGSRTSFYVITSTLIVGLSMLLYEVIEDPIRKSRFLGARPDDKADTERRRAPFMAIGASIAVAALVIGVFSTAQSDDRLQHVTDVLAAEPTSTATTAAATPQGPAQAALAAKIKAALTASTWPHLSPPLGVRAQGEGDNGCATRVTDVGLCTHGPANAPHKMYLVGDSTSIAYDDAFIELVKHYPTWRVRLAGGAGCGFADITLNEGAGNSHATDCPARNKSIVAEINRVHPDVVVVTNVRGDARYQQHVTKELAKIRSAVGKIVIVPAPPTGADPNSCYTKVSTPSDCISQISSDFRTWVSGEQAEARAVGGVFIDPSPWFCVDSYCPIFVGTTPERHDRYHATAQYAQLIAPAVREAFVSAAILPSA